MYDCYNKAFNYLVQKYGAKRLGYTSSFGKQLIKTRSVKEYNELIKNSTDKDYQVTFNKITDENDKLIEVLLGQYYLGNEPKKELYYHLLNLEIIKEEIVIS